MNGRLIFEGRAREQLRFHEINAIAVLLEFFNTDIVCISPSNRKTPDLRINGFEWELKSPQGDNAKTVEKILRKASKQSRNVILDLSRIKTDNNRAISRAKYFLKNDDRSIDRLLVITKDRRVIELK